MTTAPIEQFKAALAQRGIIPPASIVEGRIGRADVEGKRGKGDASYIYFANGISAGGFENHRDGLGWQTWRADIGRSPSCAELEMHREREQASRLAHEADEVQRRATAREWATAIWDNATPAPADHAYLALKGIAPHGLRLYRGNLAIGGMACDGALAVPLRDGLELQTLEFIASDGTKRFLPGGRKQGSYFSIGEPNGLLCIAEGYATGASIREATAHAVAIAFDAGNLEPVAQAMRVRYPDLRIVVCADDDYRTAGNPGLTKASEAARAVGGLVAVPDFGANRPEGATDFNDLALLAGIDAVKRALADAKPPERKSPQPDASSETAGDSGLRVLTLADLIGYQFPEREEILAPWLLTQSLSMIHAWRGVGKTHIALGIAYAVATGGKFLTWEAKHPRRVLYVDGEMPGAALKARLVALIETDEREFDPAYLQIITPDAQGEGIMPDLATLEGQAAIEAAAADADLIILDNISTLYRDAGPENDAESWRVAQGWALKMRRARKAVLFVHHSGKGGAQRGSSKREDTLDVVIKLKHPSDYSPDQGARFELHFEKYRNSSGKGEAKPIEAMLTTDAGGRTSWTWRAVENATYERVIELANDGLRPGEIAIELGVHKSQVSRHLKRARGECRVNTEKGAAHAG